MAETLTTTYEVPQDPHLARLAIDLHGSYGGDADHNWDEIHASLRPQDTIYDVELDSDDPDERRRARERLEHSYDTQVAEFISFIDGCMNISAVSEAELTRQIRTIRERANCLSQEGVSFELAEHAVDKLAELEARLRMQYPDGEKSVAGSVERLPDAVIKEMYMYPSQPEKNVVAELFDSTGISTRSGIGVHARVLKKIYQQPDKTIKFSNNDPYVRRMVEKMHRNEVVFEIACIPEVPLSGEKKDIAEFNREVRRSAAEILYRLGVADKDDDGRYDSPYLQSAFVRLRNSERKDDKRPTGSIDTDQLKYELGQTYTNLRRIGGAKAANRLREQFGVDHLWMYSPEELHMMQRLDEKDPVTIEHLKAGDVTVVFSNAMDDHNGAIVEKFLYRKPSGRTLRFEANHLSSIFRQMIYLNSLGIRPASLIYDTHGAPGAITDGGVLLWAAEPRGGIITHEDKNKQDRVMIKDGNYVHGDGMYRLVRDYMQPNRGIDSDDELIGKKQLVVSACSSDKPIRYKDGSNGSFVDKIAKLIAAPSDRSVEIGVHSRREYQNDVVLYGALEDMAVVNQENGRIGFVEYDTEVHRPLTTKKIINEPKKTDRLFGVSRNKITTHTIRTRKGVPVRRKAS